MKQETITELAARLAGAYHGWAGRAPAEFNELRGSVQMRWELVAEMVMRERTPRSSPQPALPSTGAIDAALRDYDLMDNEVDHPLRVRGALG